MKQEEIKKAVKDRYGSIAESSAGCGCSGDASTVQSCCGPANTADAIAKVVGYTEEELRSIPEGANMGLGCGNPVALASLAPGEVVLDLGSGGGVDCFIASKLVGKTGRVIGVDMTAEMIEKANANAKRGGFDNVEFRTGEIENLPVGDAEVNAVISNCVVNLSPDKPRVFREAYRTLVPGGRLMVSDIVLLRELPEQIRKSMDAYTACVAGALSKDEYVGAIRAAGFENIEVIGETIYPTEWLMADPSLAPMIEEAKQAGISDDGRPYAASIKVAAIKPGGERKAETGGCC
jgi:ubiquinone/menaquinone biosynthesis C-methylase UbiE